jgi:hypothetical protein
MIGIFSGVGQQKRVDAGFWGDGTKKPGEKGDNAGLRVPTW